MRGRRIRLVALSSTYGTPYAGAAEITVETAPASCTCNLDGRYSPSPAISWDPTARANGYVVLWEGGAATIPCQLWNEDGEERRHCPGERPSPVFLQRYMDLDPGAQPEIKVRAYNQWGYGPDSPPITICWWPCLFRPKDETYAEAIGRCPCP
jgi:hypothetical protein